MAGRLAWLNSRVNMTHPGATTAPSTNTAESSGWQVLAAACTAGSCPTVYRTARGTLVVQGFAVSPSDVGIDLPAGELLVEIPAELLSSAAEGVAT